MRILSAVSLFLTILIAISQLPTLGHTSKLFEVLEPDTNIGIKKPDQTQVDTLLTSWDGSSREYFKNMRVVVLDTETTGLSYDARIVELGMLEIINGCYQGNFWHSYFNPVVKSTRSAFKAHKLGRDFLETQPKFETLATGIIDFLKGTEPGNTIILAHNASFDIRMLEQEFARLNPNNFSQSLDIVFKDTLAMARRDHSRQQGKEIFSPPPKQTKFRSRYPRELRKEIEDKRAETIKKQHNQQVRLMAKLKEENKSRREVLAALLSDDDDDFLQSLDSRKRSADDAGIGLFLDLDDDNENVDTSNQEDASRPRSVKRKIGRNKKQRTSFTLEACLDRIPTTPSDVMSFHGANLNAIEQSAGVPEHLRGQFHGTLPDSAGVAGLLARMTNVVNMDQTTF